MFFGVFWFLKNNISVSTYKYGTVSLVFNLTYRNQSLLLPKTDYIAKASSLKYIKGFFGMLVVIFHQFWAKVG